MTKKAVVIHSGGMDSSLCLALAMEEFGLEAVVSLSFAYQQRHRVELQQAAKICHDWHVDHQVVDLSCLQSLTSNALLDPTLPIKVDPSPNTLVVGRNGLMAHLGGIYAHHVGAHCLFMGIMGLEGAHAGYRDCSRTYMDLQQQILRIDLDVANFEIRTPLVHLTKKESLILAHQKGILSYLLQETVTCYEGIPQKGCQQCPACKLRHEGLREFCAVYSDFNPPYQL